MPVIGTASNLFVAVQNNNNNIIIIIISMNVIQFKEIITIEPPPLFGYISTLSLSDTAKGWQVCMH